MNDEKSGTGCVGVFDVVMSVVPLPFDGDKSALTRSGERKLTGVLRDVKGLVVTDGFSGGFSVPHALGFNIG
jgi:hypothetical protein